MNNELIPNKDPLFIKFGIYDTLEKIIESKIAQVFNGGDVLPLVPMAIRIADSSAGTKILKSLTIE